MKTKIHKKHLKKFCRLVYELNELLEEIQKYCPEAVYRLNTCESMQLGIDADFDCYPYYVEQTLFCNPINDVGSESYCLIDEYEEQELRYTGKATRQMKRVEASPFKKVSKAYVEPFYNGYKNTRFADEKTLSIEDFAKTYLGVEIRK